MVKWYYSLILAAIWIIAAFVNYLEGKAKEIIFFNVFTICIFVSLAVFQFIFSKKGKKGYRILRVIHRSYFVIISAVLILIIITGLMDYKKYDGSTLESRERIISEAQDSRQWKISVEKEYDNFIISGIYDDSGKSGIAVFSPNKRGGYSLCSRVIREADKIIVTGTSIDNVWYDIVWFNGAQTEYAEIVYNVNGKEQETIKHNSENMDIYINKAPTTDYTIDVTYYDSAGNMYDQLESY